MTVATETRKLARKWRWCGAWLGALLLATSCESAKEPVIGGETHFLRWCAEGSDLQPCGNGLVCLCNVCTVACTDSDGCKQHPGAECVDPTSNCSDTMPTAYCDRRCTTDAECASLSASHVCDGGSCRAGPSACAPDSVSANEVVFLGDSFFASTHQITAFVEDLARRAGVIAAGERYRDNSSLLGNALASDGDGIATQYTNAAAEAGVKVVIMNGGGADVLIASCEDIAAGCPMLELAAEAARDLLARMANDGVQHVVYAFYPDPQIPEIRAKMDALRPLVKAACDTSAVPCHWVDLRDAFAGRYAEYVQPDGINPTSAGSQASAAAIWSAMRQQCVAQGS